MFHVEVSLGTPFGSGNMPQAGTDQHEGGFAIRKGSNDFGSTFDLSVDPFQSIVGPDPGPMLSWKTHIENMVPGTFKKMLRMLQR